MMGRRQMELGPALDFDEVAPGIFKMRGGNVYAHGGRQEACQGCGGTGQVKVAPDFGRRDVRCSRCFGRGHCNAMENYAAANAVETPGGMWTTSTYDDLDHVRDSFVRGDIGHDGQLCLMLVSELSPLTNNVM
jgi:hypothetical protein